MTRHTTIALDDTLSAFVDTQVDEGHYGSADEVVAAALRLLADHEQRLAELRAALIEGEESGFAEEFDLEEFLAEMHDSTRRNS